MKKLWVVLFIMLLLDWYAYQTVRVLFKNRWVHWGYILLNVLVLAYIIYGTLHFNPREGQTHKTLQTMGWLVLFYVPKLILIVPLLLEDVYRIIHYIFSYFGKNATYPDRRKFVSQIALGLAAIPFLSILYGITKGKYNFKVIKQTLYFDDLPENFDGFTLTHISDIHSGSFDNPEKIAYAIDLINQQSSDLLVFTGDIVNTKADEMDPWINLFSSIREHTYGKYSILGNHDYGEYIQWDSDQQREDNFTAIKAIHPKIGFKLLCNENVTLDKENQTIKLIGVENWGTKFKKKGNVDVASVGVDKQDFKILLSHDPSHWDVLIKNHPLLYQLTLSGHTHGMQFGIEIPNVIRWSPAQYAYKQWAGLYQHVNRFLYINRGFGFHAYPGRVGIMPEITVITLKKGKNI